jgi:outer membrane immunogenic protein
MKKFLIVASFILIPAQSFAADLAVKAIPTAVPQAFGWTGCYVGLNGGYGWNKGNTRYSDPNTTSDPINGIANTGFVALTIPMPSPSEQGGLGGGTAGCNWQTQRWVVGVEGDFDSTNISGSQTTIGPTTSFAPYSQYGEGPAVNTNRNDITGTAYERVSLSWLSTVRGRAGFVAQDRLLLFVTGGLAIGQARTTGYVDLASAALAPQFGTVRWGGSNTATMVGYSLGGGAEWALSDHWSAKAEYLWYDLGKVSHPLNCISDEGISCSANIFIYKTLGSTTSSVSGSIVRVGINYHFK